MSIVDKYIEVKLYNSSTKYYENLGYNIPRYYSNSNRKFVVRDNTTIKIKQIDIMPMSNIKIECLCDKCGGTIYIIKHRHEENILKNGKFLCNKCIIKSDFDTLSKISKLVEKLGGTLETNIYDDDLYILTKTKLKILDCNGYFRYIDYNKMQSRNNFGSQPFSPNNPYAIDNINIWIKKNNLEKRLCLLSKEIRSSDERLEWHCKIHNRNFIKIFHNFKKMQIGCEDCSKENMSEKMSYSIEDINRLTLELNPKVIVSGKYINAYSILHFKCQCNHEWNRRWNAFVASSDCPRCKWDESLKRLDGYYNPTIAERNKDAWIKRFSYVYIIKFWSDDYSEYLYKVGITTKSISDRFKSNHDMPYNYSVLGIIKTNLYDAINIEYEMDEINTSLGNKKIPMKKFSGHTECYAEIDFTKYSDIIEWQY